MKNIIENEVGAILTDILDDYKKGRAVDKMDIYNQPDKTEIMDILDSLFSIVYPGFFRDKTHKIYNIEHSVSTMIEDVMFHLNKQICVVFINMRVCYNRYFLNKAITSILPLILIWLVTIKEFY